MQSQNKSHHKKHDHTSGKNELKGKPLMEYEFVEFLSTYFANCYFNSLYVEARDAYNDNKFPSIEEAYKSTVNSFHSALILKSGATHYSTVMESIKNTFNQQTNKNFTYNEFIDFVSQFLIPGEEDEKTTYDSRKKVVHEFMSRIVSLFTSFALNQDIKNAIAIEIRTSQENMRKIVLKWKGTMENIIHEEIENVNSLILLHKSGVNNLPGLDRISKETTKKMDKIIKNLINEKAELVRNHNKLVLIIQKYRNLIQEQQIRINQYELGNKVPSLKPQIEEQKYKTANSGSESDSEESKNHKSKKDQNIRKKYSSEKKRTDKYDIGKKHKDGGAQKTIKNGEKSATHKHKKEKHTEQYENIISAEERSKSNSDNEQEQQIGDENIESENNKEESDNETDNKKEKEQEKGKMKEKSNSSDEISSGNEFEADD